MALKKLSDSMKAAAPWKKLFREPCRRPEEGFLPPFVGFRGAFFCVMLEKQVLYKSGDGGVPDAQAQVFRSTSQKNPVTAIGRSFDFGLYPGLGWHYGR